jgi:ribosomal protein S4
LIFKNFDFIERKLFFLKNNRKILKNVFKKNKKIEQFINKFLKKISKTSNFDFLNFFEFSLNNVLINSGFFLSKNDTYFFIKNQYIYVNNKVNTKINFELSSGDIINLSFNKYYYFLFRKSVNSLNLNINKYGNFFRKSISHDLNKDFSFIGKLTIIQNDIPAYLEVDYISMSMILLYKNIYSYNHFDLKLLPVFLKRLNN